MASHYNVFANKPPVFTDARGSGDFGGNFRRDFNPNTQFIPPVFPPCDIRGPFPPRPMLPNPRFPGPPCGVDPRGRHPLPPPPGSLSQPELRLPPPRLMGPRIRSPFEPSERFGLPWYRLPAPPCPGPPRFPFMGGPPGRFPIPRPKGKGLKGKQKEDSRQKVLGHSESGEDSTDALERKSHRKKKQKPWMTEDLLTEVKKKRLLYLKAKKDTSEENWQVFRTQRNRVSALVKEAKMKGHFLAPRTNPEEDLKDHKERPFSCDTCDVSFAEQSGLNCHLSQHLKCLIDGCQFEAHMKIVELHRKMQHDTGYAKAIMNLDSPEEIEKWRNERKKKFPTSANIEKRKLEQAEKEARGEVVETKEFGKFKKQHGRGRACSTGWRRGRGRDRGRGQNRGRGQSSRGRWRRNRGGWDGRAKGSDGSPRGHSLRGAKRQFSNRKLSSDDDTEEEQQLNGKLCKFKGTSYVTVDSGTSPEHQCIMLDDDDKGNVLFSNPASDHTSDIDDEQLIDLHSNGDLDSSKHILNGDAKELLVKTTEMNCISALPITTEPEHQENTEIKANVSESSVATNAEGKFCSEAAAQSYPQELDPLLSKELDNQENKEMKPSVSEQNVTNAEEEKNYTETPIRNYSREMDPLSFLLEGTINDTDDDAPPDVTPILRSPVENASLSSKLGGALGELMTAYGSESESEKEVTTDKLKKIENSSNKTCPEVKSKSVPKRKINMFTIGKQRLTLLEKLLANEIRHERNTILQCVHYIVKNDFFGIGSENAESSKR